MSDNQNDPAQDPNHVPDIAFDLSAEQINEEAKIRLKRDGTPASSRYKADNSGGRGNPPVKSQFQHGNPGGGRKKKDKSMDAALRREFTGKVAIRRNGKVEKVDITDVLARRKRDLALKGSDRGLDAAIELAKQYGPQEGQQQKLDLSWMSEDELNLIVPFLTAMLRTKDDKASIAEMREELRKGEGLYRLAEGPDGLPCFTRIYEGPASEMPS